VGLIQTVLNLVAVSPKEGARTGLYLASSPRVLGTTGQYFHGEAPVRSSAASHDEVAARRLWQICGEMTAAPPA
jgi:hypothetical protein